MTLTRSQIRQAVNIHGIIDRLVSAGGPLDSHPLQVSGDEIAWLDESLCHLVLRWCQRRGIEVK